MSGTERGLSIALVIALTILTSGVLALAIFLTVRRSNPGLAIFEWCLVVLDSQILTVYIRKAMAT